MDPRFEDIAQRPENSIFQVVFFPDRIYHAQYLNATRSPRYRYDVREVRGKADITVLKGEVFMDGGRLCNFLRVEYRAGRLAEAARERGRFLAPDLVAFVQVRREGEAEGASARVRMHFCPWVDAYQVELWETLEPPPGSRHDYQVLDMMGRGGSITRVPAFADALGDVRAIRWVNLAFREDEAAHPTGWHIPEAVPGNDPAEKRREAAWDNFYQRNVQVPNSPDPSSPANTVPEQNYGVDFRRGWFVKDVQKDIKPVRYRNAMMDPGTPGEGPDNVIEMRWVLQQELGGSLVFFHEVTIPPRTVEGTHQHVGSEELYYVVEGRGTAYMGARDDPGLAAAPEVAKRVFGLGDKPCRAVEVGPGSVIYTKSGGIHGIENPHDEPLRFVAFLYHSA